MCSRYGSLGPVSHGTSCHDHPQRGLYDLVAGWQEEWIETLGMKRQALHARTFGFVEGEPMFLASLAEDFQSFLVERMGMDAQALEYAERTEPLRSSIRPPS